MDTQIVLSLFSGPFSGSMNAISIYLMYTYKSLVFDFDYFISIVFNILYFMLFLSLYVVFRKYETKKPPLPLRLENLTSKL